jgi:hypothetical protein
MSRPRNRFLQDTAQDWKIAVDVSKLKTIIDEVDNGQAAYDVITKEYIPSVIQSLRDTFTVYGEPSTTLEDLDDCGGHDISHLNGMEVDAQLAITFLWEENPGEGYVAYASSCAKHAEDGRTYIGLVMINLG